MIQTRQSLWTLHYCRYLCTQTLNLSWNKLLFTPLFVSGYNANMHKLDILSVHLLCDCCFCWFYDYLLWKICFPVTGLNLFLSDHLRWANVAWVSLVLTSLFRFQNTRISQNFADIVPLLCSHVMPDLFNWSSLINLPGDKRRSPGTHCVSVAPTASIIHHRGVPWTLGHTPIQSVILTAGNSNVH